ncbi:hypothetical protein Pcinc_036531, partial [Petrolisthes cinctipes]
LFCAVLSHPSLLSLVYYLHPSLDPPPCPLVPEYLPPFLIAFLSASRPLTIAQLAPCLCHPVPLNPCLAHWLAADSLLPFPACLLARSLAQLN